MASMFDRLRGSSRKDPIDTSEGSKDVSIGLSFQRDYALGG